MLYKSQKLIDGLGVFKYEITKNSIYGVKVTDCQENIAAINDIFYSYDEALEFLKVIEDNQVTCISLKDVYSDYLYGKYKKFMDSIR